MKIPRTKPHRAAVTPRTRQVAAWFGLTEQTPDPHESMSKTPVADEVLPRPGEIVLLTGPSGSGKSSLLNTLVGRVRSDDSPEKIFDRRIDLNAMRFPDEPIVDCFGDAPLPVVLGLLSRVGLAEAWSFLRTPRQLSEGQHWRFRLALALFEAGRDRFPEEKSVGALSESADGTTSIGTRPSVARPAVLLVADEFCAVLDRVTAAVVSHTLRRALDGAPHLAALVATSHDDLAIPLRPDRIVRCDFGDVKIDRRKPSPDFKT